MDKYFVLNGHTLVYAIPNGTLGILHASILKGSPYDRLEGWVLSSPNHKLTPATREDFKTFRVMVPPDFQSPKA